MDDKMNSHIQNHSQNSHLFHKSVSTEQLKYVKSLNQVQVFNSSLNRVAPPEEASQGDCVFVKDLENLRLALSKNPACLIAPSKLVEVVQVEIQNSGVSNVSLFTTQNLQIAMSEVFALFDSHPHRPSGFIHPSASIDPTARVSLTAFIGPFVTIDAFASIGENVVIESNVFVGSHTIIKDRTILHPFCSIGTPGFGYAQVKSESGEIHHQRIPQIGRVVIEEDCELGSFCAIDRAALSETRIERGTKMDNFCHIAHNCRVGANSILAAGFIMAGSSSIGKNTMAGGGVHLTDHVDVCDNVLLVGRTGVTKSIEKPGAYGGFPAIEFRESLKALSSVAQLPKIRKQIAFLFKHLGIENNEK